MGRRPKADHSPRIEFTFEGMAVGLLKGSLPPEQGQVEYEPYRGMGHLAMHEHLKREGQSVCQAQLDGDEVRFVVHACPEYGVLRVSRTNAVGSEV